MLNKLPNHVGIPWYRSEDWDKLRSIFEDTHVLPDTYSQWLSQAQGI